MIRESVTQGGQSGVKKTGPQHGGQFFVVRPAWAVVRGWKSPRDLVAGTEVIRKASDREDGAEGSGVAKS